MGCGNRQCGNCSDCDNNYPAISSAFSLVPDNYNSVINFVPKIALYKDLVVCDKAVQNIACAKGKRHTEQFDLFNNDGCCGKECESFGFVDFPQRLRAAEVQILHKARCTRDTKNLARDAGNQHNGIMGDSLGFAQWPAYGYVRDARACGPIKQHVARRGYRPDDDCDKSHTVIKCHKKKEGCCISRSSCSKSSGHSGKRRHSGHKGGCGC